MRPDVALAAEAATGVRCDDPDVARGRCRARLRSPVARWRWPAPNVQESACRRAIAPRSGGLHRLVMARRLNRSSAVEAPDGRSEPGSTSPRSKFRTCPPGGRSRRPLPRTTGCSGRQWTSTARAAHPRRPRSTRPAQRDRFAFLPDAVVLHRQVGYGCRRSDLSEPRHVGLPSVPGRRRASTGRRRRRPPTARRASARTDEDGMQEPGRMSAEY